MIDLAYHNSAIVLPKEYRRLRIVQIGAGGTGSFAAPAIARLLFELRKSGKECDFTIIDPDTVERGNIPRSNFCFAEVGRPKAQCLAERISSAWAMEVSFAIDEFDAAKHLKQTRYNDLTVLAGCVDNYLARRSIHDALAALNDPRATFSEAPDAWWIDSGNGRDSGQVVIGSETDGDGSLLAEYFPSAKICRRLPAPSIVHPELLEPEEPRAASPISCPARTRLGEQSLNINQACAIELAEFLSQFLLTSNLRRSAAYFDLASGIAVSKFAVAPVNPS